MLIEGPLNIQIADPADGQGKILVIAFSDEFQSLDLAGQTDRFKRYLQELDGHVSSDSGLDQRNRAGMLVVQQIVEQLLPHIEAGELALEETLTVQIRQQSQAGALVDLLASDGG